METYLGAVGATTTAVRRALAVACILAALAVAVFAQPGCAHTQPGTPAHAVEQVAIEYGKGCVLAGVSQCPWDSGATGFAGCLLEKALPCTVTAGASLAAIGFDLIGSLGGALSIGPGAASAVESCAIEASAGCESKGCVADKISRHCLAYVAIPPGDEVD